MSESKLTIIKALLAKAESTDSEAEAEALNQKAYQLMAKYGIEQALLEDQGVTNPEAQRVYLEVKGTYHNRRVLLMTGLARALGCKRYISTSKGRQKSSWAVVYGMPADIERLEILFKSLDLQLGVALKKSLKNKPSYVHGKTWSVNFITAFIAKVVERVEAAEATANEEETQFGDGRFAVVLRSNQAKVLSLFEGDNLKLTSVKMAGTRSSAGLGEGRRAGERASLGGSASVGGSGRVALNR